MRVLASAAALASVALLVGAAAAPAKVSYDKRTTALRTVRTGVSYAITLENNAIKQSRAGNDAEAKKEIQNALHLLDQILPSAQSLTPPTDYSHIVPSNSWQNLSSNVRRIIELDEDALVTTEGANLRYELHSAAHYKEAVYNLVDLEIRYPMCSEAINYQGAPVVAGVSQGNPQVSVDVACDQPEQKVIIVLPSVSVVKLVPDGNAKVATMLNAGTIQVVLGGAESGGATMELEEDPPADTPVDSMIIPIRGNSHPEFFDEVM
jgi:hypothetical protein